MFLGGGGERGLGCRQPGRVRVLTKVITVSLCSSTSEVTTIQLEFRELTSGAGLSFVPHQLRHGGASDMVLREQPLWAVLRRGRWLCMKSVQRYAKPWAVLVAWSSLPPDIAREAEEVTALGDSEAWNSAADSVARRLAF